MKKLSNYQQEILDKMGPDVYLWTNEGSNYACLGDSNGVRIQIVSRSIVEELFNKNEIEFLEDHRHDWVRYCKK